jgi:hypothetical protein
MKPTLTRRDALAALAAGAAGGAGAIGLTELTADPDAADVSEADISTLVSLAEVIYPSEVTTTTEFVRTYVTGLPAERRAGMATAVRRLDDGATRYVGAEFAALSQAERTAVLDRLGVSLVESDPTGSVAAQIRYHLVNSLLYALFTSPTGSELVGIRNPTGHPGGYESLMRAPEGDDD